MTRPIYVIGHRNPDTDSICSVLGYAHLKQALGVDVIPARAGKINAETKFVLQTFGAQAPRLVTDLYPRVKDAMVYSSMAVRPDDTLRELGAVMKKHNLKNIPVADQTQTVVGVVSVGDLAKRYFDEMEMQNLSEAGVDFAAVLAVLDGAVVCGTEKLSRKVEGKVRIAAARIGTVLQIAQPGDIILASDNADAQLACMQRGIACLVVSSNREADPEVLAVAGRQGVLIIQSPYDTYTCARLINQSIPVRMIMQTKVLSFQPTDLMSDVKKIIANTNYRSFPVLEGGKLVGCINRDHLITQKRDKVILVDHNERNQAVEGIEEAKIVEIIDHHRLGGLQTGEPIFIRHEPVGATATIVANLHWHRDLVMPPTIAGLLLGAIISDTLLFKSPTATHADREAAEKLAEITGVDVKEFGMAVLKAGSGLGDMTTAEIVSHDLKEFQIGEYRVAVSQMSVMEPNELLSVRQQLREDMQAMRLQGHYDMMLFLITDLMRECTYMVFAGEPVSLIHAAFGAGEEPGLLYLPGVMSRKKQVIPPLVEIAKHKEF